MRRHPKRVPVIARPGKWKTGPMPAAPVKGAVTVDWHLAWRR